MRGQLDLFDIADGLTQLTADILAAVDRGMNDDTACERFVGIERSLPALAEAVKDLPIVLFGRKHVGEAARRLDASLRAAKAGLREESCESAILRGAARLETLAHRAEHFAHTA